MLFVDRQRVSLAPSTRKLLEAENKRAAKYFGQTDRAQQRYTFAQNVLNEAWTELNELFWGTCAFCETEADSFELNVAQFRPKVEACNLDGETEADWYWWLAYEWENLYVVCPHCELNKQNYFPVVGKRITAGIKGSALRKEKNLLLDPCVDNPANFLHFLTDGTVESTSPAGNVGADRGRVTIEVLALNRPDLVAGREKAIRTIQRLTAVIEASAANPSDQEVSPKSVAQRIIQLTDALDERGPYIAAKRQFVARWLVQNHHVDEFLRNFGRDKYEHLAQLIFVEIDFQMQFRREIANIVPVELLGAELPETRGVKTSLPVSFENAYVRSVELRNFRAFRSLKMNFNETSEFTASIDQLNSQIEAFIDGAALSPSSNLVHRRVGWKMLVGENGTGKSTILKAIALALMGEDYWRENCEAFGLAADKWLNNKTPENEGFIKVEVTKGEPIEIRFNRSDVRFVSGGAGANMYFRAYGAARIFSERPDSSDQMLPKDPLNLFRPATPLVHPNKVLAEMTDEVFNSTALAIRDLLSIPKSVRQPLKREGGIVFLNTGIGYLPIAEQSDGYNSVTALLIDILAGLPQSMRDKREASGIVMLDELDAHLHPRWKMRIVESLRRTFPQMQFICTTHEPLCLRRLAKGEIVLLKRSRGRVKVNDDMPSTTGLRVDQLLTSDLFGLESTIDPEVELKVHLYYKLKGTPEPAEPSRAMERDQLIERMNAELGGLDVLGTTRTERLFFDELQTETATETDSSASDSPVPPSTRDRVRSIWAKVKSDVEKMK